VPAVGIGLGGLTDGQRQTLGRLCRLLTPTTTLRDHGEERHARVGLDEPGDADDIVTRRLSARLPAR
jgi:hypothetical protein